jgi:hypothetical protein
MEAQEKRNRAALMQDRNERRKMDQIRRSAMILAEYQHREDPDVKSMLDEMSELRVRGESLRVQMREAQGELAQARSRFEANLEQYIPEELRILSKKV